MIPSVSRVENELVNVFSVPIFTQQGGKTLVESTVNAVGEKLWWCL